MPEIGADRSSNCRLSMSFSPVMAGERDPEMKRPRPAGGVHRFSLRRLSARARILDTPDVGGFGFDAADDERLHGCTLTQSSWQGQASGLSPLVIPPLSSSNSHWTGTTAGAPLFLIKTTRNVAGSVLLAFRSTI